MKKLITVIGLVALLSGCSNANWSTIKSWGAKHEIQLFSSDGHVLGTWYSTGQIETAQGGLCYFQDDATSQPVYIYGTFIVTIVK